MNGLLFRLTSWWENADKTQRLVTLVGAGFLVLLLAGTFLFASKPRMGMLYSGLASAEQGAVSDELQKLGVDYEIDAQGNVRVPTAKIPELRAKLALSGKGPAAGHMGYEGLEKLGMMNTPRVERERLKAILEGELAKTLEYVEGVQSAKVMITLGDDSPFVSEKKPATASVTILEKPGASLTADQGRSFAVLVSNAVPGLNMENVAVLNQRMETIFDGRDQVSGNHRVTAKLDTERAEAKNRERELQRQLDLAFGPNSTLATVNLEIDFDERDYTEITRTPSENPIVVEEATETMNGGANLPGGPAGTDGNLPGAPTFGSLGNSNESYQSGQTVRTHLQDERKTNVKESSGTLKSMSINVLANSKVVKDPAKIEEFLRGYLGPKAQDQNFSVAVTAVDFDETVQQEAMKAAKASATSGRMQQLFSLIPIVALLLVAFMVVKQIGKFSRVETVMVTTDGQMMPLPLGEAPTGLPMNAAQIERAQGTGEGLKAVEAPHTLSEIAALEGPVEINRIQNKVNVPLEQIKKMGEERPEVVAMLIKSWLLEEGIRR